MAGCSMTQTEASHEHAVSLVSDDGAPAAPACRFILTSEPESVCLTATGVSMYQAAYTEPSAPWPRNLPKDRSSYSIISTDTCTDNQAAMLCVWLSIRQPLQPGPDIFLSCMFDMCGDMPIMSVTSREIDARNEWQPSAQIADEPHTLRVCGKEEARFESVASSCLSHSLPL